MMIKGRFTIPLMIVTAVSLLLGGSAAADPSPKVIVQKAIDNQVFNLKGAQMQMAMLLKDRRGKKRERQMFTRTLQIKGLNKTLTRFTAPPDVAGTSFLFLERKDRDDDQFMFLPALKVVKRIAGSQKNASFMGSDFTYADLESRDLEDAAHKRLADDTVGKSQCYQIEAIPKKREAYGRLVTWIRKKDNVFMRTRFFDTKGKLVKVLYIKEVKKVGDSKVPTRLKLSNKQTGHSTLLVVTNIKTRSDMPESDFTVRALKKR